MKTIVVLTGAGISAESGIKTFRDADGLWEGHDVMEVASPEGWNQDPEKVLKFYNERRRQLLNVKPNAAHHALKRLEDKYLVQIITQNIDDLHERAKSSSVTHLHGELLKARSSLDENLINDWKKDICLGDLCDKNSQLRPHVVWFGEAVPMFNPAVEITKNADIFIIIGTSMQVYPAAALLDFAPTGIPIYFVDPNPALISTKNLHVIKEKAVKGVPLLVEKLLKS